MKKRFTAWSMAAFAAVALAAAATAAACADGVAANPFLHGLAGRNTGGADTAITSVAVAVTAPAKDGAPAASASAGGDGYACTEVAWSPAHSTFLGGTAYKVTVTLAAEEGYVFAETLDAKINGIDAVVVSSAGAAATISLEFDATLDKTAITSAAVAVTSPVKNGSPAASATTDDDSYACTAVAWSPAHSPFQGGVPYTVTVTLAAEEGYVFAETLEAKINDADAVVVSIAGAAAAISLEFDPTLTKTVTGITATSQPAKLAYTHGDPLDLDGLAVTLAFDDGTGEEIALAGFGTNISTVPADGAALSFTEHDGQPVEVMFGDLTANTNNLTVSRKALAVTGATHTRPYDATTGASGVAVTLGGIINDEDVYADSVAAAYTSANAGTATINITAVTLAGAAAGNYTVILPANSVPVTGGITKADPVVTWPAGLTAVYGQALSSISLASYDNSGGTAGAFTWTAPTDSVGNAGTRSHSMTFTPAPAEAANYNALTEDVSITVNKANPTVTWPTAAAITYPAALSTSALSGGSGAGTFAWTNGATIPTAVNSGYQVTFTPTDTANYNALTQNVSITVNKANPTVTWPTGLTAEYGQPLSSISLSGKGSSSPAGAFTWTTPSASVSSLRTQQHSMTFTPTNTNYSTVTNSVTITVLLEKLVPGGSFEMGRVPPGGISYNGSEPVHTVTLTSGFYMGKYQVTQGQWHAVMGSLPGDLTSNDYGKGDNYPVYYVSWYEAIVFCNKLSVSEGYTPAYSINSSTDPAAWGAAPTGSNDAAWDAVTIVSGSTGYRLPTEAQWEYAAKGGNGTLEAGAYTYSGSDDINTVAWYSGNSGGKSHEVGTKAPNGLGIYDMSGNVAEFCWDWFYNGYYASSPANDPTGPLSGSGRMARGGGFSDGDAYHNIAVRDGVPPYSASIRRGFRLVRPAP